MQKSNQGVVDRAVHHDNRPIEAATEESVQRDVGYRESDIDMKLTSGRESKVERVGSRVQSGVISNPLGVPMYVCSSARETFYMHNCDMRYAWLSNSNRPL